MSKLACKLVIEVKMSGELDHVRRKELHCVVELASSVTWNAADGSIVDQRQVVGTIGAIEHGNLQQLLAPAKGTLRILATEQLKTLLAQATKNNGEAEPHSDESRGDKKSIPIAFVEYCIHPLMNGRTCMMCLAIVDENEDDLDDERKSVSIVSHGQKLRLNVEEAKKFDSANIRRQLTNKKLSLVLDLDHTLLHAVRVEDVTGEIPQTEDIHHFFIPGLPNQHVVKLRPGLIEFLDELSALYDLFIYTHGTRTYAEQIAHIIDPKGTIFQHRIVARTDTPEMLHKSLKLLFPSCDDSMILVLDDRIDVWKENEGNVILIEPYHFFKSSAEINNASGRSMLQFQDEGGAAADIHLAHTKRVLQQVHERFFQHDGEPITVEDQMAGKGSDVKRILYEVKKTVLTGCNIVFSGLFPIQGPRPPESRYLWRLAVELGATPSMTIDNFPVTHLVIDPARLGTQKHNQVKAMPNTVVVVQEWLLKSARIWSRAPETEFLAEEWKAKLAQEAASRQSAAKPVAAAPPAPVNGDSTAPEPVPHTETKSTEPQPPVKPAPESILVKESRVGSESEGVGREAKKSVKFTAEVDAAEEQRANAAATEEQQAKESGISVSPGQRRPIRRVIGGAGPGRVPEVKGTVASGGTFDFLSKIKQMGAAKPRPSTTSTPLASGSAAATGRAATAKPAPGPAAPSKDMDDAFLRLIEAEEEEASAADSKRKHGSLRDELANRRPKRAKNETAARPAATDAALYHKAVAEAAATIDAGDGDGDIAKQDTVSADNSDDDDGELDDLEADILDDL